MKTKYEELVIQDEHLRGEFAKAFGWIKYPNPTWEQIFIQVGKLLVLEELKQKIIPINFEGFKTHQ